MSGRTKNKPDTSSRSSLPPIVKRIINAMWTAAHEQTPESEARNAAMLACRLLVEHDVVLTLPAAAAPSPPKAHPFGCGCPICSPTTRPPEPPPPYSNVPPFDFGVGSDFNTDYYQEVFRQKERVMREHMRRAEQEQRIKDAEAAQRRTPPPPPADPRPPDGFSGSPADFVRHVQEILDWEAREKRKKDAAKARREDQHREAYETRRGPYSGSWMDEDPEPVLDAEQRRRRRRAWMAAGKPTRQVYDAGTDTYTDVPDFSSVEF